MRNDYENFKDSEEKNPCDDITWKVNVDVPAFEGTYEPQCFLDWLADMDHLFDWYKMSKVRRVRYAKLKLQGSTKVHWMSMERRLEEAGAHHDMVWNEKLKKYISPTFKDHLLDQLSNLKQKSMTVEEYMTKFDELVVHCDIQRIVVLPFLDFALY